nr:glutamate-5-semialdehyde dehydrogenase [Texcoconibacillus texcoconensis]
MISINEQAKQVKSASDQVALLSSEEKKLLLETIADQLVSNSESILSANEKDLEQSAHESQAILDRLRLTTNRIESIADSCRQVANMEDPIGETIEEWERPNGLLIRSTRVPLGVIGMIYEARPNVTVDATALSLKTGNAVLLRGSSSSFHSNNAIVEVIHQALAQRNINENVVQLVQDTSREAANEMLKLNESLDVLIPRGGAGLIKSVVENATVPVLETGVGNCHVYIDETADPEMAISISVDAKTDRPSVCNAAETILVHEKWLERYGHQLITRFIDADVQIYGDNQIQSLHGSVMEATDEDWSKEYLDLAVAMKTVSSTIEAIDHVKQFGTGHSESIITEQSKNRDTFLQRIDAAALYHNASTRFTDGGEFGFGAEIGISTQKLHARGPMGLKAMTSSKYLILGTGQTKS